MPPGTFYFAFYNNPDPLKFYDRQQVFKEHGILTELIELNEEDNLKKDLVNYLISVFKYQTTDNVHFGVDFTTGWWFNRNLKIFRTLQKIKTKPTDKILFIIFINQIYAINSGSSTTIGKKNQELNNRCVYCQLSASIPLIRL